LIDRFPNTDLVVTPGVRAGYTPETWQEFLAELGYSEMNERAFFKEVPGL
jgi:hypothetical protein